MTWTGISRLLFFGRSPIGEDQRQQEIIRSRDWKRETEEEVYEQLRQAIRSNQKQVIDHLGAILYDAMHEPIRKWLLSRYRRKFEAAGLDPDSAAEDVLTQMWLYAMSDKRSTYKRKRGKIRTWLHRVASSRAIDMLRKESRIGRSKTFDIDTPLGRAAARRAQRTGHVSDFGGEESRLTFAKAVGILETRLDEGLSGEVSAALSRLGQKYGMRIADAATAKKRKELRKMALVDANHILSRAGENERKRLPRQVSAAIKDILDRVSAARAPRRRR